MMHEETESIAALDALGIAGAGDAVVLGVHVASCIPCRRARDEYRRATTLLALGLDPIAPPRHVRERLVESVTQAAASRRSSWWLVAAAAILVALFGVAALLVQSGHRDTRVIALTGQRASAQVFLERNGRSATVVFRDLPANAADKSYQLWIIRTDQPAPVSVAVFDAARDGKASIAIDNLPVVQVIKMLAVTLEPRGGVPQPTNTDFVVAGNVGL